MANKQDNRPNVDHTNHSSDSESDSVDSSRSETDVQETTTAVLETQPEPPPRDGSVRDGQDIAIGGITKDLEEFNMGSDSSAVKDFQPATINLSGDDLPEGRTASPVQASENPEQQQASPKTSTDAQLSVEEQRPDDVMLNPLDNTIGSHARDQQSLREDSEVLKLRSDFEEYKRSVSILFEHTAVEVGQMQAKLNAMASAYEANVLKLWPEKLAAVTKEVSEVRKKLTEMAATNEEEILKLQSDFEKFQESTRQNFQNAVETVIEMQKNLNEIESANAAEREKLKNALKAKMFNLTGMLSQQILDIRVEDTGSLPDDNFPSLWRDFLSQPVDNFKQGGFVYIDPRIISCKFSIGPSGKALVYVRESFEGLWKCIGGQADKLPASMTTAAITSIKGLDGNYLITGTPGTGKSCFAYYLLPHLLAKEGDSVLYQNCHKDMKFFVVIRRSKDRLSEFEVEHYHMPTNSLPKPMMGFLGMDKDSVEKRVSCYIFDSGHKSGAKPESTDVPTIVISSPDCDQYKDFMQMCPKKFYVSTWEWPEIGAVVRQLHPDKSAEMNAEIQTAQGDFEQETITKEEKKKRERKAFQSFTEFARANTVFRNHGGVIREVLNPYIEGRLEALHTAIDRSSVEMVRKFLNASGDVPCTVSHRMLHQVCDKTLVTQNGRVTVDYQKPSIVFASDYIARRFLDSCLQNVAANQAMYILNMAYRLMRGNLPRYVCGKNFESLAHDIITRESGKGKRKYKAKPLHNPKKRPMPSMEEKQIREFSFDFKHTIEKVQYTHTKSEPSNPAPAQLTIARSDKEEEAYIIPRKGCPAFDAFLPGQKIFLQMTMSKKHLVVPELLSFLRSREPAWKPEDVSFVFVVLEANYSDFHYQELLHAKDLKSADREAFEKIKQYALPLPSPDQKLAPGDQQYAFCSQAYYQALL